LQSRTPTQSYLVVVRGEEEAPYNTYEVREEGTQKKMSTGSTIGRQEGLTVERGTGGSVRKIHGYGSIRGVHCEAGQKLLKPSGGRRPDKKPIQAGSDGNSKKCAASTPVDSEPSIIRLNYHVSKRKGSQNPRVAVNRTPYAQRVKADEKSPECSIREHGALPAYEGIGNQKLCRLFRERLGGGVAGSTAVTKPRLT